MIDFIQRYWKWITGGLGIVIVALIAAMLLLNNKGTVPSASQNTAEASTEASDAEPGNTSSEQQSRPEETSASSSAAESKNESKAESAGESSAVQTESGAEESSAESSGEESSVTESSAEESSEEESSQEESSEEESSEEESSEEESSREESREESSAPTPQGDYDTEYLVRVNKDTNVVTIFVRDSEGNHTVPYKAMICSTGPDTPTGTWLMSYQAVWNGLIHDLEGHYVSHIVGNYLFHSVPYTRRSEDAILTAEYNKLGTSASAGCVRLTTGDCDFMYQNCTTGSTVIQIVHYGAGGDPLGKPDFIRLPTDVETCWDPTNPSSDNPWNDKYPYFTGVEEEITIFVGDDAPDLLSGVKGFDTCGNDISERIELVGSVNSYVSGTYEIDFFIRDALGRTASATTTVIVAEAPEESSAEESQPEESAPEESSEEESQPEESVPEESSEEESKPEESVPEESLEEESRPEESVPEESSEEESQPEESVPEESSEEESQPDESSAEEPAAEESSEEESLPDDSSEEEPAESAAEESNSQESVPKNTDSGNP